MPKKSENPSELRPTLSNVGACRWELIMPMLQANKAEDKQAAAEKAGGTWSRFWTGVKDIRTGIDPQTGREFIAWKFCGVALIGGPFESQRVTFQTTCPQCGHDAADLCRTDSLIQRLCRNCRLDHHRAMHRNAAKRRRRVNGEVTTPLMKACETCGEMFFVKRSTARFCSTKCRVAAHRSKVAK